MPIGTLLFGAKILKFFVTLKSMVLSAISAVFQVALKHPVQTAVVIGVCVGAYFLNNWAYDRGAKSRDTEVAALTQQVERMALQIEERNSKIQALEDFSTVLANAIQTNVRDLQRDLEGLRNTYEAALAEARKNPKVITKVVEVKLPGEERIVEVMVQNGNVVCDRYPEGYDTTVNKMVDRTIETMRKGLQ